MRNTICAMLVFAATAAFANATLTPAGDMKISKKDITATASFYQYRSGAVLMEVLAVRAPDGTVRTAFNTCQVCYSSGRGYYTQKGDVLVCNNCGNKFKTSQVGGICAVPHSISPGRALCPRRECRPLGTERSAATLGRVRPPRAPTESILVTEGVGWYSEGRLLPRLSIS